MFTALLLHSAPRSGHGTFCNYFCRFLSKERSPHGKNLITCQVRLFQFATFTIQMTEGERARDERHCKPHLQKHFSCLLKTCSLDKQHDSQRAIYHLKFVRDWNSELCLLSQWEYNELSFWLPHLFRRRSLKHGWDPLFVDFILVSPQNHWQLSWLAEELQYGQNSVWGLSRDT